MPFKSSKVTYGLSKDPYPQDYINNYNNDLKDIISLKWELVAVKLFFTKDDYEACEMKEPVSPMPYCVMVKQAAKGKGCKSRLEHHKCDGATTALALEKSTDRIESGEEYFSYNLYASKAAARRHRNSIKSLHQSQPITYGILVQPLRECIETPDVIIGMVNPYQAMRIVQGYEYYTGVKPQIDMGAMQGICSEVTASPYLTGQLNVSVLCPSTRMLCKWGLDEMAVGIPFEQFVKTVEGVVATQPSY